MVARGVEGGVVHGTEVPNTGVEGSLVGKADGGEAVGAADEVASVDFAVERSVAIELRGSGFEGVEAGMGRYG